ASDAVAAVRGTSSTDPYQWRHVWDAPPPDIRDALLARALEPAHIGCGHLRLQLTDPKAYGTRDGLVRCVLSAFHRTRWQGHPDMEYVPLAGGHTERAVVNVRIAG